MQEAILQNMLFPVNESIFYDTLIIEVPNITADEGREIVADFIKRFPNRGLRFEVKKHGKEEDATTTRIDS